MSGAVADGFTRGATFPTATQLDGVEHDTALRAELVSCEEGVTITRQTLWVRDSTKIDSSAFPLFVLRVVYPTATHVVMLGHETLTKMLFGGTCGLVAMRQSPPLKVSMSG